MWVDADPMMVTRIMATGNPHPAGVNSKSGSLGRGTSYNLPVGFKAWQIHVSDEDS